MSGAVFYDFVPANEVEDAHKIEAAGYPEDEAASLQALRYRQEHASGLFLGAYETASGGRRLIGFICATLSPATTLTHESMSTHVPGSPSVCIHSVCVSPDRRRQGVAVDLLKEYIKRTEAEGYERILLITHEELRPLYEKAGFLFVENSAVVHGSRPWFEMQKALRTPPPEDAPQAIPVGLWDALQRSSARARPRGQLLSTFPGGLRDVSDPSGNKFDLLCPQEGCGSIILMSGVASLEQRESVQMEPSGSSHPALPSLPPVGSSTNWWKVTGSAMAFENIGFSRGIASEGTLGKRLKLLLCAECDLGPLGWCEEGGSEFWLACERVSYRE